MNLQQKAFKIASYIFIAFITLLIILTFGMPDFISSSAGAKQGFVAEVGDEVITKTQLNRTVARMKQQYNVPNLPDSLIEGQAIQGLISQKLLTLISHDTGLYPGQDAQTAILARLIKENFPEHIKNGRLDVQSMQKFLNERNLTISELRTILLNNYVYNQNRRLLNSLNTESPFARAADQLLAETTVSLDIIALGKAEKEEMLKKRITISENEIQKKFKDEYLSENKEATLDKNRREAIKISLRKEKLPDAEKKWQAELQEAVKNGQFNKAIRTTGKLAFKLNNLSLNADPDQKKPESATTLAPLKQSAGYRRFIASAAPGSVSEIIEAEGNIYIIRLISRNTPEDIVTPQQLAQNSEKLPDEKETEPPPAGQNRYFGDFINATLELARESYEIRRYSTGAQQ